MKMWERLKARLHTVKLKKKQVLALLATALVMLGAAFAALNTAPATRPTADPTSVAASADTEADNAADASTSGAPPPGSSIVHNLPNDMESAPAVQYTTHFARWEFACPQSEAGHDADCDGFPVEMDPVLMERLEALRCALGRPVVITSGIRCAAQNAAVDGIAASRHMSGKAADLYCPGVHYTEVARVARAQGLWALEYPEEAYVHVEV